MLLSKMRESPTPWLVGLASVIVVAFWWQMGDEDPSEEADGGEAPVAAADPPAREGGAPSRRGIGPPPKATVPPPTGPDGTTYADPRLVPGQPGVAPPAWLPEPPDRATGLDPDRHRARDRPDPPPVDPPHVEDRAPGVPPTPQGAGESAHEVWSGEPDEFEPVDEAAVRAELEADVGEALSRARGCFSGGRIPALEVTVAEQRNTGAGRIGYVGTIGYPGGAELSDELGECVMEHLEELTTAAPPGARRVTLTLGAQ